VGQGIWNDEARLKYDWSSTATLEADDIVTENYLTDGTRLSNCAPVDTIPHCIG